MSGNRKGDNQSFIRRNLTEAVFVGMLGVVGVFMLITYNGSVKAQDTASAAVQKTELLDQHIASIGKSVEKIEASAQRMADDVAFIRTLVIRHDEAIKHNDEDMAKVERRLDRLEE